MTTLVIQDCRLPLYSFVEGNPPQRVTKYACGFSQEVNETVLYVIDWKIREQKVLITYQTRNDAYAPIYDTEFAVITETVPLSKPGRSKNWDWNEFSSYWFNRRTGERVPVH